MLSCPHVPGAIAALLIFIASTFASIYAADSRPVVLVLAAGTVARSVDVDLVQIVLRKPCNIVQLADLVRSCVTTATRITSPVVCRSPLPQAAG